MKSFCANDFDAHNDPLSAMTQDMNRKCDNGSKLVVVIEDDPLVLEATDGLLRSWGYAVVAAQSLDAAMARLSQMRRRPDLIVCDYHLAQGESGLDIIEGLRSAFQIPALLISADPVSSSEAGPNCQLLQKPVHASAFRAALVDASVVGSSS